MGIPFRGDTEGATVSSSPRIPQQQQRRREQQQEASTNAFESYVLEAIGAVPREYLARGIRSRNIVRRRQRDDSSLATSHGGQFEQGGVNFMFEIQSLPNYERGTSARVLMPSSTTQGSTESGDAQVEHGRRERMRTISRVIREHENRLLRETSDQGNADLSIVDGQNTLDVRRNEDHEADIAGEMTARQRCACFQAANLVIRLIRNVSQRVHHRASGFSEMSHVLKCVEIILGTRSDFSTDDDPLVLPRTEDQMVTLLLQRHRQEPSWRDDHADDVLMAFHDSIERGDLLCMLNLIPRMIHPIYLQADSGDCALHVACMFGQHEMAQLLVDMGHPPDQLCEDQSTPLADAAGGGFVNLVRYLTKRTPDCVTMQDVDGDTPLHNAARGDHAECCKVLLSNGAHIDAMNRNSEKPINLAPPGSETFELLNSRYAHMPPTDRQVLNIFQEHRSLCGTQGFQVIDIVCLSNNRLIVSEVGSAMERLMADGLVEITGGGEHWILRPLEGLGLDRPVPPS